MTDFHGVFAVLDTATEDGRLVETNGVVFRDEPFPLLAMEQAVSGGHNGSRTVGRIDRAWIEGDEIRGEGIIDPGPFPDSEDEETGILDVVISLLTDGIIYGGADFDQCLYHNTEEGLLVATSARFMAFTLYLDGALGAWEDRTWIQEGPWPA